jgi:hypothetical protein
MKTIQEIKDYAMKHYKHGGDVIIECWSDEEVQQFIDEHKSKCGKVNEHKLKENLNTIISIHNEYWEAARFFSGEEAEAYANTETETDENNTETEEHYEDYADDPCYGCQACDHGYNCKHCIHGDDGRYETPFDVYTPSELGISVSWH